VRFPHPLTLAPYPTEQGWEMPNQPTSWQTLAARLQKQPVQRVLLESSGGYEKGVAHARQQAGLPVVIVPAQRARHFAKSMRGDLKTDRVDAQLLAYFACCLTPFRTPSEVGSMRTQRLPFSRSRASIQRKSSSLNGGGGGSPR
jgi:transposase